MGTTDGRQVDSDARARLLDLRRELQDGDDLVQVLGLISDTLHRRFRRVRVALHRLERLESGDEGRHELRARVSARLKEHEERLTRHHEGLTRVITDFQHELEDVATSMEELE